MNDSFKDREGAFEAKYAHDEEFKFKANARRNKLLGLWVSEQMGLSRATADAYAKQVVMADFEEPGDGYVIRKVLKDLTDKGIVATEEDIIIKLDEFLTQAIEQLSEKTK